MTISFLISKGLKRTLEREAKKENRSLSNYIDTIIRRYLQSQKIKIENDSE